MYNHCTTGLQGFTYMKWFPKQKPRNVLAQKCIPLHNKIECLCSQILNNMQLTLVSWYSTYIKRTLQHRQMTSIILPSPLQKNCLTLQLWYHDKDQIPVISSITTLMTNLFKILISISGTNTIFESNENASLLATV